MEFNAFKKVVSEHMNRMVAGKDKLFLTGADKHELWECYLNSFPEEERQSHNCNNCRHFIGHYGMMVTITNGVVHTIWENLNLEEPYATVAKNLDALVRANAVRDVFVTREYELGVDKNGAEKRAKKQKLMDLIAKKQDAELEGKSVDELMKELAALED